MNEQELALYRLKAVNEWHVLLQSNDPNALKRQIWQHDLYWEVKWLLETGHPISLHENVYQFDEVTGLKSHGSSYIRIT